MHPHVLLRKTWQADLLITHPGASLGSEPSITTLSDVDSASPCIQHLKTVLQDADLSANRLRMAYTEMVLIVRKLYQECRLVHGDLSEYNILFHQVRHDQHALLPIKNCGLNTSCDALCA